MSARIGTKTILLCTAFLAAVGMASSASALVITGGPVYSLPGGGSCTVSGIPGRLTGATVSCTGVNLAAHSNVYFGIKNDSNVNGLATDGSGPSGGEIFGFSSAGGSSITYTSTTSATSAITVPAIGTDAVSNTMVVALSAGSATVVSTGGTPASNGNGAIERLFRLTSGSSFTFEVDITSSHPDFGSGQACTGIYDPVHATFGANGCLGRVDVAFYYSDCGDGVVDSPEACDLAGSNGSATSCCTSTCTFRTVGQTCRNAAGVCDLADTCTGSSATCPADGKSTAVCRGSVGICDVTETCDGAGNNCPADVVASSSVVCRGSGGICDVVENCTGSSNTCPADGFVSSSTECRASGGVCDIAENCTGSGALCPSDTKSTALCRGSAGVCDVADFCDGAGNNCPADAKSTAVCRGSAGTCDVVESCDGAGDDCPSDAVEAGGTECRGVAGTCDVAEDCDGVGTDCPADGFVTGGTECRAVAGVCDVAEQCTGSGAACPSDGFEPSSTVCRASSVGEVCDIVENCTGSGAACPADAVEPSSTVCRASGGICDITETCDGVGKTCPTDAVEPSSTVCRAASVGQACDAVETCDGAGVNCPADGVLASGTDCRSAAGVCDLVEECNGVSSACPSDSKSTAECRGAAGVCDIAESCDGAGDNCPSDTLAVDGTSCEDGAYCNGLQACTSGVCGGGSSPCSMSESCDEATNECFTGSCPSNAVACRTALKNKVLIKNKTDNTKDKLIWKWTKGDATTTAEFSDPTASAEYALCFYAGTASALIQQASVPGGANWAPLGTKGFKYKELTGSQDGITKVIVKGGVAGKSKALVKGKGMNLPDFDSDLPFGAAPTQPLIVQLRNNSNGICWEGSFSNPKKDELAQFKAKAP